MSIIIQIINFKIYFLTTPTWTKANRYRSNTHLSFVFIELFDFKGFSKWIDQVLFFINFLKLDIISIHNLSNKMTAT